MKSPWMKLKDVAAYLNTSERHIRELVYKDVIPYSKAGRLLRFHRGEVDKWMEKNTVYPKQKGGNS